MIREAHLERLSRLIPTPIVVEVQIHPNSAYPTQGTAYIGVSIDYDANRTAATSDQDGAG